MFDYLYVIYCYMKGQCTLYIFKFLIIWIIWNTTQGAAALEMASDKKFVDSHRTDLVPRSKSTEHLRSDFTEQARSAMRDTCGVQKKSLATITPKFNEYNISLPEIW